MSDTIIPNISSWRKAPGALFLVAVLATAAAIGGSVYYLKGPSSVGLQCETKDEKTNSYSPNGPADTQTSSMVIELNGSTWRVVSIDGRSWRESIRQLAKASGKPMPEDDKLLLPLRVTPDSYVLTEPGDTDGSTVEYPRVSGGFFIDRVSGKMTVESHLRSRDGSYWVMTKTTGHCTPINIKANL